MALWGPGMSQGVLRVPSRIHDTCFPFTRIRNFIVIIFTIIIIINVIIIKEYGTVRRNEDDENDPK
jgi:purine-cytosine permease-like protein